MVKKAMNSQPILFDESRMMVGFSPANAWDLFAKPFVTFSSGVGSPGCPRMHRMLCVL